MSAINNQHRAVDITRGVRTKKNRRLFNVSNFAKSLQRNLLLKFAYQRNDRDGGRLRKNANHVATQVVYWF